MMARNHRVIRRLAVAGQCAIIVLGLAWAVLERQAPLVNIRWRDGLSAEARRQAETQLLLARGEPADGAWRYELTSPRSADIAAIIAHPNVQDTHRIDRDHATLSPEAGRGTLRVWWAGPFRGGGSRGESRVVFAAIGLITLIGAVASDAHRRTRIRRLVAGLWS